MYSDVTGIILAGGKSTRMGHNKAFLKIGDITIVERVLYLMKSIFINVIIISNTPEEYKFLGVPVYKDIYEYRGPLAGIHSGLHNSNTKENFIISVDMPLMNEKMIKFIMSYRSSFPITVCRADGFIQQLAGRYSRDVIKRAEHLLSENEALLMNNRQTNRKCNVLSLLDDVGAEIIDVEKIDFYEKGIFYNMNNANDYKYILSELGIN